MSIFDNPTSQGQPLNLKFMPDQLYFDNFLIGNIENLEAEFPNFSGQFTVLLKPIDDMSKRILSYIDFSQRQTDFYLNNESENEQEEGKLAEEENTFDDLINSNSWYIIDHSGQKVNILIPAFDSKKNLSWRINFD